MQQQKIVQKEKQIDQNKELQKQNYSLQNIKLNKNEKQKELNVYHIIHAGNSQAGKSTQKVKKTNQDCIYQAQNFCKQGNYLFAVYDGHGEDGEYVSQACKDAIPLYFQKFFKPVNTIEKVLENAFSGAQQFIEQRKDIQSDLSGSTATVIFINQNEIYCANVGDSKAIICYRGDPIQISIDHTPYIKTEYERIINNLGRVHKVKDYYDVERGPLRVWLQSEDTPGLAMTRSMGDIVSKKIGVIAEPQISKNTLKDQQMIVLASDGVWDKVKDYQVEEIVKQYYNKRQPQLACDEIIKVATNYWNQSEEVMDDISCIVIFVYKE